MLLLVDRRLAPARPTAGAMRTCPRTAKPGARRLALWTMTPIRHDERFHGLGWEEQGALVQAVRRRHVAWAAGCDVWSLWTRYASTAFYSHPWAWNEIGFGGPPIRGDTRRSGSTRRKTGRSTTTTVPTRSPSPSGRASQGRTPAPPARNAIAREPLSDTTMRARNESAWLVPDGDARTNHRLRADMRRFADDDEVDIVIVGAAPAEQR